jgi:hypothetical protein
LAGGVEGFCATVALASIILHEMMHLCAAWNHEARFEVIVGPPPFYSPSLVEVQPCDDLVRMAGSIFGWAMGQRYSCVQPLAATCCSLSRNDRFAHSGVPSNEVGEFPWNHVVPC